MKHFVLILLLIGIVHGEKLIIGKNEYVSFPHFSLENLRAKVDTGAKTSSLHCSMIKQIDDERVMFVLLDENHKKFKQNTHILKISRIANVKSSNGSVQKRIFVKTNIVLGKKSYLSEFSLNDRGNMKFPVLLGRSILKENFLVDVEYEYLLKK